MSKKSTKALASAALMSLVLTTALSAGPVKAAQGKITRTSGATRYATASQVATTNWTSGSDNVVLVSGEGYADAVSASALAKKLNAPILLTTPDTLSADAQTALNTLKPKNIYVIGGTASISQSIRDGLKANYTLTELGGATRYETNAAVADELVKLGVDASNVMVVGGQGFSDALSVAPVAAAKGQILLLANNDQTATKPVIDFINANKSKVTVVGTSNVINDTIYNALGATTRVDGGNSRFDTNLKVLAAFKDSLKTDKLYIANASAADPDNLYADALVASAVAGKYSAPLVLVDKDGTDATNSAIAYIKDNGKNSDLQLIGGTAVVPQTVEDAINKAVNPDTPSGDQASEVQSIESVGLNQIKVTFNGEVDQDTAETVSNYKVDGTELNDNGTGTKDEDTGSASVANENSAKAVLQDDNKTVLITLAKAQKQSGNVDVTVKKGILSDDKSQTVPEFTQNVTFSDTTAPTLSSVEDRGSNKLTVKFSEPVNFGNIALTSIDSGKSYIANAYNSPALSKFKINDQNITSFGLDGSGLSQVKNFVKDSAGNIWSNEIDLYFNSSLQPGNNTLKVSDGDNGLLYDSASFPFQETTQDFNVDTLTTTPQVNSITASDDGKIYINFDRPMDANTAVNKSYYVLNSTNDSNTLASLDPGIKVELKKDDTQVKISGVSSYIKNGSNTIYIKNSIKDAYGNKVADDTRESFTLTEDTTKPAVSSVTTLDDTTIRVRFNKDVSVPYATNTSNYELQDNSGTDITNDTTKGIKSITVPGGSTSSASVFDINTYGKLTEANYTIKIKNIIDTASNPNTMDDYVQTFAGSTTVAPTVTNAYKVVNNNDTEANRKVVVYFSTAMDSSSITDTSNYKFVNGSGDTKTLPSGTTISASSDNKSAIIEFPSSYGTDKSGSNLIKGIAVLGVKDQNGNTLEVNYQTPITTTTTTDLPTNTNKDKIDANSIKFVYDGDNLKVQFKFTQPIDTFDYSDFTVNGVKPTSGYPSGDVMTLQFNDGDNATTSEATASGFLGTTNGFGTGTIKKNLDYSPSKIEAVKFAGKYATIGIASSPKTIDVFGTPIASTVDTSAGNYTSNEAAKLVAYNYNAAPKTVADEWYGTLNSDNSGAGYVDVTFDTPVDQYSGIKTDDFVFSVGGKVLKADNIKINPDTTPDGIVSASANTVRFLFNATTLQDSTTGKNYFTTDGSNTLTSTNGAKINVYAKSTASIRTLKDGSGNYANYVPSSDDTAVRYITIGATTGAQKN